MERWANSGAMALTGLPDEPLGPPAGLVEGVERLGRSFPGLDTLALLGERAALMGLWRRGGTSCGGSCRLLPCADGFMAVSLPRDEDMEMVPAWLELDTAPSSVPASWSAVATALRRARSRASCANEPCCSGSRSLASVKRPHPIGPAARNAPP